MTNIGFAFASYLCIVNQNRQRIWKTNFTTTNKMITEGITANTQAPTLKMLPGTLMMLSTMPSTESLMLTGISTKNVPE